MSDTIKINAEIDLDAIKEAIENSGDLNDNEAVFGALAQVARVKNELGALLDKVASVEAEAKATIVSKGNALYGVEWTAIKGQGYKITRSKTGSVYAPTGEAIPKKFRKVVESIDAKLVDAFVLVNDKLPEGIDYNPNRGSSLRITVNTDEPTDTTEA